MHNESTKRRLLKVNLDLHSRLLCKYSNNLTQIIQLNYDISLLSQTYLFFAFKLNFKEKS